jgi:predicted MFS family arabinose efflux permease
VAGAFATHAVISGSLGPWIPRLKTDAGLDPAGLGIALTGYAVGLLVGTRLAAPSLRRGGGRGVVRIGIPVLGAGFSLLPVANDLASLTAVFVGIGLAAGLIDVAMNAEAVAVEQDFDRRVLSAMHGTWSVFVFVGAAVASIGVAAGIPIDVHLPVAAAVIVLASFPMLRWLPDPGRILTRESSEIERPARAGLVVLLCLIAGAVFLAEGIAIEWSALYLRGSIGTDAGTASLGVVAFSAGMVGSRFAGDRLAARIDQSTIVRVGGSIGAFALASALIAGGAVPAIVALGVMGLSLGPIVPLVFRAAGTIGTRDGRTALPIVVTAGYAGSIVGPLVVGFIADLVSLRAAFTLPVVACAVAAIAAEAALDP